MSGVYIPDFELPRNCYECPFAASTYMPPRDYRKRYDWCCVLTKKSLTSTKRNRACPLTGIPDHGRLVDLDAYYDRIEQKSIADGDTPEETEVCLSVLHLFNEQICPVPTIIDADKETQL